MSFVPAAPGRVTTAARSGEPDPPSATAVAVGGAAYNGAGGRGGADGKSGVIV
ncbi:hypothetical protein H7J50_19635 [Mycobacterium intermedium]|uniref:hypothetical protein n=1 Tax=Mycobacterium intermedium TaxID=28445 RepID=UPI0012EA35EE|nr:hypothetical protein [Mycobacterium intermedium]MCV6966002.1 hypothetical protein [Mycobacterium intermedium]